MDALTEGNRHGKGVLNTSLGAYANAMSHRHTGAEVGVGESFGGEALHQCTYDAVGTWVPTGCDDADGACLLVQLHETLTIATDVGVYVERIDGVDA